ncbi:MAG: porin family protein [Chitinophagaceae bacterium]
MRQLAVLVLAMIFAGTAFSQGFGAKAGIVLNYIDTEGNGSGSFSNLKVNHTFGFSYAMVASKNFHVQPELNFTHLTSDEGITNSSVKLNYIQIPVLLKGVTNNQNFSFYVGPQLSFNTKASLTNATGKSNIEKDVNQTGFDAVVGMEYVLPMNITINARYVYGTTNVFKAEYDTFKSRHQFGAITVGYLFRNKKK